MTRNSPNLSLRAKKRAREMFLTREERAEVVWVAEHGLPLKKYRLF